LITEHVADQTTTKRYKYKVTRFWLNAGVSRHTI